MSIDFKKRLKKLKPTHYTTFEGGPWIPWRGGVIDSADLAKCMKSVGYLDGVSCGVVPYTQDTLQQVHSLAFNDPAMGNGNFPRWDCINGWTTPLLDLDNCIQCGSDTGVKYPRGSKPYCEDCGWPDEDFGEEEIEEINTGV